MNRAMERTLLRTSFPVGASRLTFVAKRCVVAAFHTVGDSATISLRSKNHADVVTEVTFPRTFLVAARDGAHYPAARVDDVTLVQSNTAVPQ